MINDLVSVIITTHERNFEILSRAVRSVKRQTYSNIEVIVVDDSSKVFYEENETEKKLLEISNSIRYICYEDSHGACYARNIGLENSNGKYVAFLDDDDEWLENKIELELQVFDDQSVSLVYCGYLIQNGDAQHTYNSRKYERGYVFNKLLEENFIGSTSSPLIKKQVIEAVGGFDEKMEAAQDYDLWLRISKDYKVDYVEAPLLIYYQHAGEQISKNKNKRLNGTVRLLSKFENDIKCNRRGFYCMYIRYAKNLVDVGEKKKAVKCWAKAVGRYPFNIKKSCISLIYILRKGALT